MTSKHPPSLQAALQTDPQSNPLPDPQHASQLKLRSAPRRLRLLLAAVLACAGVGLAAGALSQTDDEEEPLPVTSLKRETVPGPAAGELDDYIRDRKVALQLGKALFWDRRVGSDNQVACATCHFHAGADARTRNQINPGTLGKDFTFQLGPPNHTLSLKDFPLTRFANLDDPATRHADVNDVVGSQGVHTRRFVATDESGQPDRCTDVSDAVNHGGSGFNLGGVNTRRVEPRNTPSVINAVFNLRNFWDGRASSIVNGVDHFGPRNAEALLSRYDGRTLSQVRIALPLSALGSLSSGPPLSADEMSCAQRSFAKLGSKLANVVPLSLQTIDGSDSVLGPLAYSRKTYYDLVRAAFQPAWWSGDQRVIPGNPGSTANPGYGAGYGYVRPGNGRGLAKGLQRRVGNMDLPARAAQPDTVVNEPGSQYENNFALFFGLAVQMYLRTLVSDDAPLDRYLEGRKSALTAQQLRGLALFNGKANCLQCHDGPLLSAGSLQSIRNEVRLDKRPGANGTVFRYDHGFFNTGVRPTRDDPGVGGVDPFGNPLSDTRLSQRGLTRLLGRDFDAANETPVPADALTAVDGAFKVPGLRNVELTGPYFHNGGKATLMQVVDFYSRGGDFAKDNGAVVDPRLQRLGLTEAEKQDLVAFLLALTDERVRYQRAPFDHPSLCLPNGHAGDERAVKAVPGTQRAADTQQCVPAVGAAGSRSPLRPFLEASPFAR